MGIENCQLSYFMARRLKHLPRKMRDLPTIYARHNRFTGEIVAGQWDVICELDKREWTNPQVVNRNQIEEPIALVKTYETGEYPAFTPVYITQASGRKLYGFESGMISS